MPQISCPACEATFPSQQELMQHAQAFHPKAQAQEQAHTHFACQACGVEFHSQAELQEHAKSSHAM